jgi:hypothetical protein
MRLFIFAFSVFSLRRISEWAFTMNSQCRVHASDGFTPPVCLARCEGQRQDAADGFLELPGA